MSGKRFVFGDGASGAEGRAVGVGRCVRAGQPGCRFGCRGKRTGSGSAGGLQQVSEVAEYLCGVGRRAEACPDVAEEGGASETVIAHLRQIRFRYTSESQHLFVDNSRGSRFAQRCGLTKRETEVFGYLARGRSLPYIADALFVTTGTVKTHTVHIYRKLQVNSKQELMDLFEAEA